MAKHEPDYAAEGTSFDRRGVGLTSIAVERQDAVLPADRCDVAELFLPWQAVGCEVIDADADLVATFANPHDAWPVVDTMNGMRT